MIGTHDVSERRACRVLGVSRSSVRRSKAATSRRRTRLDQALVDRLKKLIAEYPSFGYRRLWALLRRSGLCVNRKKIYRILKLKGWLVHQRRVTPRPRVRHWASRAKTSNTRWAMDVTHVDCGRDGWGRLVAVIDCYDREIVGWEFALRGRAKEAERALEAACLRRFGTLRPDCTTPVIRSDNGLIFQSRRFRKACRFYRLRQEYITPYTPEQNGLVERWFRRLKEECVWLTNFSSFRAATTAIARWIRWYNQGRPHQTLKYLSPAEFRSQQLNQVA